ncbi:ATP-binding protein [Sporomusa acidovorans]|uniref:histidine kinase n=1 Tax=Sporomusa acidovorans (strain ATCC 49682 / DSM 3132 / Mol) TaxID=1123286 RepID=A0ABZ3J0L7_SPOA4|nr:ATP-binding protein [Sporomusa acidovorans]OZC22894.1 sensor histidine kinase DcuS [Sporomusa acidovorans DSM 3132]SDF74136.1 PAS fold [Sporomusa acidovorans]
MTCLVSIIESIQQETNTGTICELEMEGQPVSYLKMPRDDLVEKIVQLTDAIIQSIRTESFTAIRVYISQVCKLWLEQGIKLSDIMLIFDLYEKSIKDAMSFYLKDDLVSLNIYRRQVDSLLDRTRVYVSEYFFTLYEEIVYKQFEQLRAVNEIAVYLTSSLDLHEVLDFIVTSAIRLFKADCGSILLLDEHHKLHAPITTGWHDACSSTAISETIIDTTRLMDIEYKDLLSESMKEVFKKESLFRVKVIKLYLHELAIGVLIIGFRSIQNISPVDQKLLETFASHAAIAVHNAQLYGDADFKLQQHIHQVNVILEQNRAIMHCIREGVLAVNADGYINLVNTEAQRLLGHQDDIIGKHIWEVLPNSHLPIVIRTGQPEYDQEQEVGKKVIITNRVPLIVNDAIIGAIATFRDKQDVKVLAEELVGLRSLLESMRAQSHEFVNKLHAISGLIQMKQYDKVVELIALTYKTQQDMVSTIVRRIKDQATAGLIIGKISQSSEQGISLRLNSHSKLFALPQGFSDVSMVTVLGNLITNAMEAVANLPAERRVIHVYLYEGKKYLTIRVGDLGTGIPEPYRKKIYQRGFSTKQGSRGVGLALVLQEVRNCGGTISVQSSEDEGSTFTIKIPVR